MKSTSFSSTVSLVTGLAFVIVMLLFFSLLVGCDSSDEASPASGDTTTQAQTASKQRRSAVESGSQAVPVTPAVAVETGNDEIEPAPEVPAVVSFEDAESLYRERDYTQAQALFERYVEQNAENPWGHYMLGLSAWKSRSYESAESAFLTALELDSTHVKSSLNLARVYLETDRAEEALSRISDAEILDPTFGVTLRLKGRALHELGRLAEAEDAYREAIRIDDRDAWSMNNLGLVLQEEGFYTLALAPLARATELREDVATFFNNLGMALEHNGYFRDAENAYRSAVELDDTYEKASENLKRVEAVEQDPALAPVDLEALARDFEAEIVSWSDEDVPREDPVPTSEHAVLETAVAEEQ